MCVVDMDDEDFTATEMCCACDGGKMACTDTDFSSTDRFGKGCQDYSHDMCIDDAADDEDFTASSMCCICDGGGVTPPSHVCAVPTTTTTTNVTALDLPGTEVLTTASISLWWLLLLLIIPAFFLAVLLFRCCCGARRVPEPQDKDCFVIDVDREANCFTVDASSTSMNMNASADMTSANAAAAATAMSSQAQGCRYVVRDEVEEGSVYATGCDILFNGPPKGGSAGGDGLFACGGSGLRGPVHPSAAMPLDGSWTINGRQDAVATIIGSYITVQTSSGKAFMRLMASPDGKLGLEHNGTITQGQNMGSAIIWASGETWRRAGPGAGCGGGLVVPANVLGSPTAGCGVGGGSMSFGGGAQSSSCAGGASQGYSTSYTASGGGCGNYRYAGGGSPTGLRAGGLDGRDIMLADSAARVPGEGRMQSTPHSLAIRSLYTE